VSGAPLHLSRRAVLAAAGGALVLGAPRVARAAAAPCPVLFVSHGSPRLAIDAARYAPLRAWGRALAVTSGRPRGIVVMTPHFASRRLLLGSTARGFAMYDLPGPLKRQLPPDLDYATPPSEALAVSVERLLHGAFEVARVTDRPGFDHTTWIPLRHLFPAADAPVLEVGFPYLPDRELFALGTRLAPLRDEGVVFVASGGMTHNLASMDLRAPAGQDVPAWSREFDAWTTESLDAHAVDALLDWRARAPAAELAHPDDGAHFRVLLVALGVASRAAARPRVRYPVTGYESTLSVRGVELA
jgi:4,5-DOPA dioxygenase extradiol